MLSRKSVFPEDFFSGFFDSWLYPPNSFGVEQKRVDNNSLVITVELPGVTEKDINVEISSTGMLNIKGERKTKTSSYSVVKSFSLPEDVDSEQLQANLKDGILTITIPGKQLPSTKEGRKITVTTDK